MALLALFLTHLALMILLCCAREDLHTTNALQAREQKPILPGKPLPNSPLHPFAVSQPLLAQFPPPPPACTVTLVSNHSFAFSFGLPAISAYSPPREADCGKIGSWARVVMTFSATSNGNQFDRLSSIYLQGVEIWRTSTPEPTVLGIDWVTQKDVTRYKSLFSQNGTLVLDLANLIDASSGLTGIYDVTLTITYVPSTAQHSSPQAADVILPLSLRLNDSASIFLVPPSATTLTTFPPNAVNAFVEIYASGDSSEEFWYGNVPDQFFDLLPAWTAPDGQPNPHGPFREVQLLIDGKLAGVVFPYPVIYSGEFLPSIWRPMLSYGAFDSPTYTLDITHFIPSLADSATHNFTLVVVSQEESHVINADWIVTGNIQVTTGPSAKPTTGRITKYQVPSFATSKVTGSVTGSAQDVSVTTVATHALLIEGEIVTGNGARTLTTWQQDLTFSNSEIYRTPAANFSTQRVSQASKGCSTSTHNGIPVISDCFQYPFDLFLTFNVSANVSGQLFYDYGVHLNHSFFRSVKNGPLPGSVAQTFSNAQQCDGTQSRHQNNITIRTGQTADEFKYSDSTGASYFRDTEVATFANNTVGIPVVSLSSVVRDRDGGSLAN